MDNYEKVIEKLVEYGDLLCDLVGSDFRKGEHEMHNIDRKVKLIANRIYKPDESDQFLIDSGYHESLDIYPTAYEIGGDNSAERQRGFNENLNRRINAIENLIQDFIEWGLPSDIKSEEVEKGIKIGGKLIEFNWRKKTKK